MKVSCNAIGGPSECPFVATGDSTDEIMNKLTDHIASTHPNIKAQMDTMSEQERSQWMDMTRSNIQP